jgi:DNA-binding NarL/FixJ family response regulator
VSTTPAARVILAEDHALVRQAISRALVAAGIEVVAETDDGLQVADIVASHAADVLVLDMGLPGLHGLDVLRKVGRHSPKTRVLVLSADGRDEFVIGAIRAGAAGYVLKGADLDELIAAIKSIARGGRYISPALSDRLVSALTSPSGGADDPYETLSEREREVFHLMAEGLSNADIGTRLFVSPRTVETHRANVLRKLNLRSQTEVVIYAIRRGLVAGS